MASRRKTWAMVLVGVVSLGPGCAGPALRPDGSPGPEACPDEALGSMRIFGVAPGDRGQVYIDANQPRQRPITLSDGPIESILIGELGILPARTRLYGRVWTTGPNVTIRYDAARAPRGERFPFCGVAVNEDGGLKKLPGSLPGTAMLPEDTAPLQVVDVFR